MYTHIPLIHIIYVRCIFNTVLIYEYTQKFTYVNTLQELIRTQAVLALLIHSLYGIGVLCRRATFALVGESGVKTKFVRE